MGKPRSEVVQRTRINFWCPDCGQRFEAVPGRVEDAAEREWHPWRYFADCECGAEAVQVAWEQAMLASWGKQTGPKTAAGKAKSAANLEGHPTREEAQRTRFNAMKHGLFAQTATYYPAKPGGYAQCEGCEYRYTVCAEQVACLKRTELFMKHHIAFETKDPALLTSLRANLHANVQAIIDDIILAIIRTGVELKTPAWYYDKDGVFHLAEYLDSQGEQKLIYEINAHPLLKTLADMIAKNNLALGDMVMTPKVQEDSITLAGHLQAQQAGGAEQLAYQERQVKQLEALSAQIERSRERVKRDPVLIEHGGTGGG